MVEQYAVIVGLLSAFTTGRDVKNVLDIVEFQAWLSDHNHDELVRLIDTDTRTNIFVKAYLNQQVPELQRKLDTIIDLVKAMAGEGRQDELAFSGSHFLKGVLRIGLERIIDSRLNSNDFDIAHSYVCELIGDDVCYNKYVLEKVIRVCLERSYTSSHVLEMYWLDFTENS